MNDGSIQRLMNHLKRLGEDENGKSVVNELGPCEEIDEEKLKKLIDRFESTKNKK